MMSSMLALQTSNITGGTFTLVNGDMHYHGLQENHVFTNHVDTDENPPLSTCPFFQDVQLSVLSVGSPVNSPKTSFQISIWWEGIPPGVRICVKKILAKYNGCCILQIDTRLEMAESSGKGHVFATVLPGGMHQFINFADQVLNCKEVKLTLLVEGSSSSSNHDHDFRMEKSIPIEGFDSFRPLITLCDLDICESNGEDLTAMLNAKIENPTSIKLEIGAPGLEVEIRFGNQKVGYAKIEDVCLQHRQVFHRRLHWKLEPVLNKYHTNAFIARYLSGREAIPITLHIPVCFVICGRSVILDPLVVPVTIKGIGFRLIQEVHSYFPLQNPISADIQIRFIDFVAFESSLIFRAKHKFENFVLTSKEQSWSPKVRSQVTEGGDTYSTSGKVNDIFLSADITIRTPGTNRGLDIQNLSFRLRDVPFKAAFTL